MANKKDILNKVMSKISVDKKLFPWGESKLQDAVKKSKGMDEALKIFKDKQKDIKSIEFGDSGIGKRDKKMWDRDLNYKDRFITGNRKYNMDELKKNTKDL
jgi:hypothetical protein